MRGENMDIKKLYNDVFNEDGTVKLCGRNACKALIMACQEKFGDNINFGNTNTGMMNVENIQKYIHSNHID
jgi:hypothetical protein